MKNIIVTRYGKEPPKRPPKLNGVLYDHWHNAETNERYRWDGKKWQPDHRSRKHDGEWVMKGCAPNHEP